MTIDTPAIALQHVIGADGLVVITVDDGDIRIRGVDGDTVRIRVSGGESLDALEVERGERSLTIAGGGGRIRDGRRPGHTPELDIEMPAGAGLVLHGASADLTVDGLVGDQRYRTASGDLTLRGSRGSVTVEAMSGDVDISATGPARYDLRTVSGDLALRAGVVSGLLATTTSGDLQLAGRFDGPGPFTIETVSGDISLAPTGAVRIDIRTITGDLHSEIPGRTAEGRGQRSLIVGEGGPTLDVRSTSGDVNVVRIAPATTGTIDHHAAPPVTMVAAPPPPPVPEVPPVPSPSGQAALPATANDEDAGLAVLRALERGDVDIDEARRRLAALDREALDREVVAREALDREALGIRSEDTNHAG